MKGMTHSERSIGSQIDWFGPVTKVTKIYTIILFYTAQ